MDYLPSRPGTSIVLRALAVVGSVLAFAACSATPSGLPAPSGPPGPDATGAPERGPATTPARWRPPVREATDAELSLLDRAEQILTKRCMEEQGFKYWLPVPLTPDERRQFDYVVDDVGWATRHGYGTDIQAKMSKRKADNPNRRYRAGLPGHQQVAYDTAYRGSRGGGIEVVLPSGVTLGRNATGCSAEAERALYGDLRTWFRASSVSGNLPSYAEPMKGEPTFVNAVKAWSACMRRRHLPFASPEQLRNHLSNSTEGMSANRVRDVEVRLATAEATCARSTRLAATVRDLSRRHETVRREQYGRDLDTRNHMRLEALDRAREVVSSEG